MLSVFIIYLLKSAFCLLVFSIFFRLLMLSDTFIRFSRIVLLSGVFLSLLLPLVELKVETGTLYQQPIQYIENIIEKESKAVFVPEKTVTEVDDTSPWEDVTKVSANRFENPVFWAVLCYVLGVLFMLARLGYSFYNLWEITREGKKVTFNGQSLIVIKRNISAFSFFRNIVISEKDYNENPLEIITHEQMHSKYWHSIDAIFIELLLVVQWFNVGLWSLRSDMKALHEYEADRGVLERGIVATKYQLLLVKKAVGERCFTSFVNSFNHSLIKNRITMMLKKKTNPLARLKAVLMLPLAVGMLYAFAEPAVENTLDTLEQDIVEVVEDQEEASALSFWRKVVECDYKNKGDVLFLKSLNREQKHLVSFWNVSEFEFEGQKFPANFDMNTVANFVEKSIYEKWKYFQKQGTNAPQLFGITKNRKVGNQLVVRFTDALLQGYDQAITKIAKEVQLPYEKVSKKYPLLIVFEKPSLIPPPPPPPGYEKKEEENAVIEEVVEKEPVKQCYIETLDSMDKGMYVATNYPIEILREVLKPERKNLQRVNSFTVYFGQAAKVNTEVITEYKNLLRKNSKLKISYNAI